MRICPKCGKEVPDDSKFCPSCALILSTIEEPEPAQERSDEVSIQETEIPSEHTRQKCPECGKRLQKGAQSCASCGLVFYTKQSSHPAPVHKSEPVARPSKVGKRAVLGFLLGVLILGIFFLPQIKILLGYVGTSPSSEIVFVEALPTGAPEFDLTIDVLARPTGLVWNGRDFLLGNQEAHSVLRLTQVGDRYAIRKEEGTDLHPVASNGKELIGYHDNGFTVYDAFTLKLLRESPAPEPIGGLAWDGVGYWAASRKDKQEDRGFLYRLDQNLKEVNKMVSPFSVCGGLAWDGSHLWFLDDLGSKVHVLDVKGIQVRMIQSYRIPVQAGCGIAFDGHAIWICDYARKRLLRMNPQS